MSLTSPSFYQKMPNVHKSLNRTTAEIKSKLPVKILQFGEGNFLRAFADWCIQHMNEAQGYDAGVAVVQPIEKGLISVLRDQEGIYHHVIQGIRNGEPSSEIKLIDCIQRAIDPFIDPKAYFSEAVNPDLKIIISNTTEAGIQFDPEDKPVGKELAKTFPGKLTQFLAERFKHFKGATNAGLVFMPCELIEKNGENLRSAILNYANSWGLEKGFLDWLTDSCFFANTLVDRIVPGYPKDKIEEIKVAIGYKDKLVVSSEIFHLWVIQGPKEIQSAFPANEAGLNVKFVSDLNPYRSRKVRILNGAHTSMVPVGLLSGIETVRESLEDELVGSFIKSAIDEEIAPTIELPADELEAFSLEVIERFLNPYIRHELKSISLNSISKYKVRVLPSVKDFLVANDRLPKRLIFSLTCLIRLYLTDEFHANDDQKILDYFNRVKNEEDFVAKILGQVALWGEDLNAIPGLREMVNKYFEAIENRSIKELLVEL